MAGMKKLRILIRIIWRSFFIQAWWNFERLQSLGLLYTLLPLLKELYKNDPEKLLKRKKFYEEYFNTNPIFFSILAGALAKLEIKLSKGEIDEDTISTFKVRMMSTLGAIGDTLTWNGVRPLAAFTGTIVTFAVNPLGGLITYITLYNTFHLFIRIRGFFLGYKKEVQIIDAIMEKNPMRLARLMQTVDVVISAMIFAYLIFWIYQMEFFSFIGFGAGPIIAILYFFIPSDLVTIIYFIILIIGEKLWPEIAKL